MQHMKYSGYISSYEETRATRRAFCIASVVLTTKNGPRRLSLNVDAGIKLYNYLNICRRFSRLDDIHFVMDADYHAQTVHGYSAYDLAELTATAPVDALPW